MNLVHQTFALCIGQKSGSISPAQMNLDMIYLDANKSTGGSDGRLFVELPNKLPSFVVCYAKRKSTTGCTITSREHHYRGLTSQSCFS
jgi:hypothetical protein